MIKTLSLGLAATLFMVAAPSAQTPPVKPAVPPAARPAPPPAARAPAPPPIPLGPPRAFAGYTQPEIGAAACRVVSQAKTICTIPAMTAGRYRITATGTATATAAAVTKGEGAAQALQLDVGQRICGRADRRPTKDNVWSTGAQTLIAVCEVTILTDRPIDIAAVTGEANATPDPKGPTLKVERLPWDGILASGFTAGAPAPAPK
ncbi:hypothetical protein [Caulobacter sp. NIBR1757]|uniref:hypothetical protein n=1 Tax=Caulobacter sp. NIBR1757 TaxID=3016000 RepID=UPI0022F0A882|nr:hypothetical protein [Caulobacter sp. NIBR1757]WGM40948.1 hypothetical protein AMEJIAPC_03895 [Caulobacter sp. NIBR1757]